jgi:deoxyuridine 5'-triphosphate nucleotidohydrolase
MPDAVPVLFQRLHPAARLPERAHATDGAYDVYLVEDVSVPPLGTLRVPLCFAAAIAAGYFARLTSRSSTQFFVREGLIDSGYRGEWRIAVQNLAAEPLVLRAGERIGQVVLHKAIDVAWQEVAELPPSDRGTGGFGSTGR